jgi:heme-degrading monooxygenase HmoA
MYVVIFRAEINQLDAEYSATADRMRQLALSEFGCLEFHALTEGSEEIALSYWPDLDSMARWRAHPEHVQAQDRGRNEWYRRYRVEITRIERSYVADAQTARPNSR